MYGLKSGFWQVKMAEDSRQYTAFTVGSMGVYEFLRMPYGLCNAPSMFQRLMQNCLGELNLTFIRNSIRTGPTIMMMITLARRTLTIQLGMTSRLLVSKLPDSRTDGDAGVTAGQSGTA